MNIFSAHSQTYTQYLKPINHWQMISGREANCQEQIIVGKLSYWIEELGVSLFNYMIMPHL